MKIKTKNGVKTLYITRTEIFLTLLILGNIVLFTVAAVSCSDF